MLAHVLYSCFAESLLSSEGRSIPAWGSAIFSPLCLCITPKTPEELSGFMKYAVALTRAHLMVSLQHLSHACTVQLIWSICLIVLSVMQLSMAWDLVCEACACCLDV